jgi:hypothetical protein
MGLLGHYCLAGEMVPWLSEAGATIAPKGAAAFDNQNWHRTQDCNRVDPAEREENLQNERL